MAHQSSNTIDCLTTPPPYTSETEARLSGHTQHNVSEAHIIDYGEMNAQRSKVCCDTLLCKFCLAGCLKFKRVLCMMSTAGVLSVLGAVILGAARTPENNFLTLSLLFGGLGIVLITVVIIGWRCTPPDHEPCHLLFGLGTYSMVQHRPFFGRRSRRSSRFYWFGDRLFPEFRYRRPPPTYAASMQEYHQSPSCFRTASSVPKTPPPVYKLYNSQRNRARKGIHIIYPRLSTDPHCLPPLYRERTGSRSPWQQTNDCSAPQLSGADNEAFLRETSSGNGVVLSVTENVHGKDNPVFLTPLNRQSISSNTISGQSPSSTVANHQNIENPKLRPLPGQTADITPSSEESSIGSSNPDSDNNIPTMQELETAVQQSKRQSSAMFFYDNLGDVTHL